MRLRYVIIVLIIIAMLYASFSLFQPNKGFPRTPKFSGYNSTIIRIQPMNLTQLKTTATKAGYNVSSGYYLPAGDEVRGSNPSPYIIWTNNNMTVFNFAYDDYSNTTNWMWQAIQDSMKLNDSQMEKVKIEADNGPHFRDSSGLHVAAILHGTPNWVTLAHFLGVETGRDYSHVGYLIIKFNSGAYMKLNTECIRIEKSVKEDNAMYIISVDGDSDIDLWIVSNSKLKDPMHYFVSMFDSLGIPESEVSKLVLKEFIIYLV